MNLSVYNHSGAETGRTVELDDSVFGLEPNDHVIWLDVKAIQAHGRQGTHKTKERGEVAYSRKKLYRQKGTGNARAGDRRSPVRVGGGTIFGPKPHEYRVGVNKKTRRLARRSALSHKMQQSAVFIMEDLKLDTPKTQTIANTLKNLDFATNRVLLLTPQADDVLYRSSRNIQGLTVRPASEASTVDLMGAKTIILLESAVTPLTEALRSSRKTAMTEE